MSDYNGGILIKFNPLQIQIIEDSSKHYTDYETSLLEETFKLNFEPDLVIWSCEFNTMVSCNGESTYEMESEDLMKLLTDNNVPFEQIYENEFVINGYSFII